MGLRSPEDLVPRPCCIRPTSIPCPISRFLSQVLQLGPAAAQDRHLHFPPPPLPSTSASLHLRFPPLPLPSTRAPEPRWVYQGMGHEASLRLLCRHRGEPFRDRQSAVQSSGPEASSPLKDFLSVVAGGGEGEPHVGLTWSLEKQVHGIASSKAPNRCPDHRRPPRKSADSLGCRRAGPAPSSETLRGPHAARPSPSRE